MTFGSGAAGVLQALLVFLILPQATAQEVRDQKSSDNLPPPRPVPRLLHVGSILPRESATLTITGGEDLQSLGVRFLDDAFRIAPGLEVARISAAESSVSVRSYHDDSSASQGILGLRDGRQVNNDFFGSVIWELLPVGISDVQSIHLIRGPGSFAHGPNAMHGLVNIVTLSPLDYPDGYQVFVHGHGGSYRSNVESLTYVRREGATGLKVSMTHDDIDSFEPRHQNARDKGFLEIRLTSQLDSSDHLLDISVGGADQRFDIIIPPFGGLPASEFNSEAVETYARVTHSYGNLRTQVTWTRFDATTIPTPVGLFTPFDVLADAADLDIQYSHPVGESHRVTAGTGYRYSGFGTEDSDVARGRHHTGLSWLFLQDEVRLSDFTVTAGFRVDDHSIVGTNAAPRLAVVWTLDPLEIAEHPEIPAKSDDEYTGHYLRATAGYGYRNPSLRELWFDMPVFGGAASIQGNRDLERELMRSSEIGYWGRPTPQLQLEASVYYNLIDHLVQFEPVTPTLFIPINVGKEEAYGFEVQADYQFTEELYAFANYAYGIRRDRDTHERLTDPPVHKANAGTRVRLKSPRLEGMIWVTFFDDTRIHDPSTGVLIGEVDEYALLNARIAYTFDLREADRMNRPKATAFVQAFNLLDHDHREHPQGDEYGLLLMGGLDLVW